MAWLRFKQNLISMKTSLHVKLRFFYLVFLRAILAPNFFNSRIRLSYFPGRIPDGLGAQLQRIIAINGLGWYLKIQVSHSPISEIAIHPLDNLSPDDYKLMLVNLNRLIDSTSSNDLSSSRILEIDNLTPRHFFIALVRSYKNGFPVNLRIRDSYYLVDANPGIYQIGITDEMRSCLRELSSVNLSGSIAIHHRHGVGGMAIQPGQTSPREVELARYFQPLRDILSNTKNDRVIIFTDAPRNHLDFEPPVDQRRLWQGLPRFENDRMRIDAGQFHELENEFPVLFEYRRGGNPLVSLADLSSSSCIVLSRSSFGYVAALFANHSNVWIPKDFWHPRQLGWKTF